MTAETDSSLPSLLHPTIQNAARTLSFVAIIAIGCVALWSGSASQGRHHDEPPVTRQTFQVDLNCAAEHELMLLPGVGPRTAERILEDRKTNGPFLSLDDLQRVPGIGPKTIQEIAPHCRPIAAATVPQQETLVAER
ncbi:helix-hairpin-helix domain-containing protein [Stieleria sp. ICT_E10.1]|uniref:ComEA family DNA-binding protein n=1 Tax=Stieleria sedimenti TaxID=2976331 RepID=UPI00218051C4|nr:helix-hairpin-helix domain-containing protein [Stieleria sedimenti]MCS7468402.1 helix-hairpin-helix domain-containing protein [Stieleria sedimenti]